MNTIREFTNEISNPVARAFALALLTTTMRIDTVINRIRRAL